MAAIVGRPERATVKLFQPSVFPPSRATPAFRKLVHALTKHGRQEHAILPRVLGAASVPDDKIFGLATEYLAGDTLAAAISAMQQKGLSALVVTCNTLKLIRSLASGLAWLHQTGTVHGNIKPGNILITESDPPAIKLLDLCWARAGLHLEATLQPMQGPPEDSAPAPRSDQWAVAHLMEESLTEANIRIPTRLRKALAKAKAEDPNNRFEDMGAFFDALTVVRDELNYRLQREKETGQQISTFVGPNDKANRGPSPAAETAEADKTLVPHPLVVKKPQEERTEDLPSSQDDTQNIEGSTDASLEEATQDLEASKGDTDQTRILPALSANNHRDTQLVSRPAKPSSDDLRQDTTDTKLTPTKPRKPPIRDILTEDIPESFQRRTTPSFVKYLPIAAAVMAVALVVAFATLFKTAPQQPPPPTPVKQSKVLPHPQRPEPRPAPSEKEASSLEMTESQHHRSECQQGIAAACMALADLQRTQDDLPNAQHLATQNYEKACALKHIAGCIKAADRFMQQKPHPAHRKARRLYEKACDARSASACHQLANLWKQGLGGARNQRTATAFLRRACKLGHQKSCP